jgi:hypothetical protein
LSCPTFSSGNTTSIGEFKTRQWQGRQTKGGSAKTVNLHTYLLTRHQDRRLSETVSETVIEVLDSEDKGKGVVESDSEEETQFGLVWGSPGIPETELQDSDVEEDNIPISQLQATKQGTTVDIQELQESYNDEDLIPISQLQAKQTVMTLEIEDKPTGEACIGKLVMKQFDAGLFTGTVMTATKKRGRFLYHVEYEDGDCQDFNDKEFGEAYDLYTFSLTSKKPNEEENIGDSDNDCANSGGETEGSEYDARSDKDEITKAKKKRRTSLITKKSKEKGTMKGGNKSQKEEDGNKKTKMKYKG